VQVGAVAHRPAEIGADPCLQRSFAHEPNVSKI
jgi:hypothetical protein